MAITHSTASPYRSVDITGRALPMTVEEIRAHAVEVARGLDALDDMGDEAEQRQTLDSLMKAIDRLFAMDERQGLVVTLRFFAGLSLAEVASSLDVSVGTVEADWRAARA